MRQFFIGNVMQMYVKNIQVNEDKIDFDVDSLVLKKDEIFYQNIFGVILRFYDKHPMTNKNEAYWYIETCVRNNPEQSKNIICPYIDYDELNSLDLSKREVKNLQLRKRKQFRGKLK